MKQESMPRQRELLSGLADLLTSQDSDTGARFTELSPCAVRKVRFW